MLYPHLLFQSKNVDNEKTGKLLDILERRPDSLFSAFCVSLDNTDQSHVKQLLSPLAGLLFMQLATNSDSLLFQSSMPSLLMCMASSLYIGNHHIVFEFFSSLVFILQNSNSPIVESFGKMRNRCIINSEVVLDLAKFTINKWNSKSVFHNP